MSSLSANPSIKQYLQQQQLQEVNNSLVNKNISNSYHPLPDSDENRLVIQEDEDEDKDNINEHKDVEMEDTATQLVILGSGRNTQNNLMEKGSINVNNTNYGETLDLSKGGKESKLRGENHNSQTAITLCSSGNPISYQSPRLSSISTIGSTTLASNTTVPSVSSIVAPATFNNMTIFPASQSSSTGSAQIQTSNISNENVASLQTSLSHHIKLKGKPIEGNK